MILDLNDLAPIFFEEAAEHVAALEAGLLVLEQHPGDADQLNAIFRAAHSVKGASATFGFNDVARFTHALEGLLDGLREGKRALDRPLSDLLLRANDALRRLLDSAVAGRPFDAESEVVLGLLNSELGGGSAPRPAEQKPQAAEETAVKEAPAAATIDWTIQFVPAQELFATGGDPVLLLRELASLGEVLEVTADASRLPHLDELDPELAFVAWTVVLRTTRNKQELIDVFCFVEDGATVRVEPRAAAGEQPPEAAPAPEAAAATASAPAAAGASEAPAKKPPGDNVIRVAVEKVDELVNLVGELVITQSMVRQALDDSTPAGLRRLREAVAEMERNTRELQERVMGVRMVPISTVWSRFPRLIRDLAPKLGKTIVLEQQGEDTELDKGLVERIGDPLTHLVRNSADHGLETPEERRAAGKPEAGTLRLSARHQGGAIVIEISDDGRGLDLKRIRQKAVEQGLIHADATLSDTELQQLIFLPGFSTAKVVSAVSGRGVGMDVVKRNIEALNGSVHLESVAGKGTTCRIRLPLTMAILDGLTLRVGDQLFVLPLASILESFRPREGEVRGVLGRGEVVLLRGETVPLVRLHRVLGITPEHQDPRKGLVSVLDAAGTKVAVLVDELMGQAQVVVKTLEQNYRRIEGVMGATILGDGRVALILDVATVTRSSASRTRIRTLA